MVTGWLNLGGTWYYLNANGAMATGWLNLGGTWYYLNATLNTRSLDKNNTDKIWLSLCIFAKLIHAPCV